MRALIGSLATVMSKVAAAPHITGPGRFVFARLPFEEAVLLHRG
ncbi:hypothetical protein ACORG1_03925 [Mycobacterium sp. TJFP1]